MADIILFDRKGNEVTHEGIETITFDTTTEGEQATFTEGVAVEGVEIIPDFSSGDMPVDAETGTLMRSVTVRKPESLKPENILAYQNIAGIFGTAGAYGGESIVAKSGTYTATVAGEMEIVHNLGVVPDVIMVHSNTFTSSCLMMMNGISRELKDIANIDGQTGVNYGTNAVFVSFAYCINEADTTGFGFINSANPRTFKIGGTSLFKHSVGAIYTWTALGGLVAHPGYLTIKLALDGNNLTITGGVPEIQQFKIYTNGELAKTVDYVYQKEFAVDISDVTTGYEPVTFTVEAVGESLDELYPNQYYDSVANNITAGGTFGDGLLWVLTDDGTMTISGAGAMPDFATAEEQPWYNHAASVKTIRVGEGITYTGMRAFQYTSARTITLPDSLTGIARNLAYECTSLTSITIPDTVTSIGMYAFYNCTALTSVNIPDGVTSICDYTFRGCTALTSVNIPDSVTSIGVYAFRGCTALASVNIPDSVTSIGNYAFYECTALASVNIPDSVTSIGGFAFRNCSKLTSITIPAGVTVITDSMIRGCTSLSSVTILGAITSIGQYALADSIITSFVIPDTVTSVALGAFYNCNKMTSVTIGSGVKKIGKTAFTACSSLTKATFRDTSGWYVSTSETATSGTNLTVTNTSTAANYLRNTYQNYYWFDKT